jgi:hypothetical protein
MKRTIKAAGVLPYSKDAHGDTWFLLGREKPNKSWGIDSGSWSEFGGSITSSETPEEGAAREFFEETMGCMWHKSWMAHELQNGRYLLAMDSKTPSGKGYRSFVKYVPFLDYPGRFARYKTLAKKQPEMFRKIVPECFQGADVADVGEMLQTCVEKTSLGWFSVDQMRRAVYKYKQARTNIEPPGNMKQHQTTYYESDMIPHIRRGFAMDFDHLLTTEWAKNNFQCDYLHFPRVTTTFVQTASGTLRPLVKTPRCVEFNKKLAASAHKDKNPPIIQVSTDGYSFKKKRKRNRHIKTGTVSSKALKKTNQPVQPPDHAAKSSKRTQQHVKPDEWTLVTNKKKKPNKEVVYKPTLPIF